MLSTHLLHERIIMAMTLKEAREWLGTMIGILGLIAATIGGFGVYVVHQLDDLKTRQSTFELKIVERQVRIEGEILLLHRMIDEMASLADKLKSLENRMNEPKIRQ